MLHRINQHAISDFCPTIPMGASTSSNQTGYIYWTNSLLNNLVSFCFIVSPAACEIWDYLLMLPLDQLKVWFMSCEFVVLEGKSDTIIPTSINCFKIPGFIWFRGYGVVQHAVHHWRDQNVASLTMIHSLRDHSWRDESTGGWLHSRGMAV